MEFTPKALNRFLLWQLPSAFLTGVRVVSVSDVQAVVQVKHRWINQNPFRSLYYGVQAMAAELATGILVMKKIQASGKPVSMLVTKQEAVFTKKGRGVVRFTCDEGGNIDRALSETLRTGEGQIIVLHTQAMDAQNDVVSSFSFEWSIKLKQPK